MGVSVNEAEKIGMEESLPFYSFLLFSHVSSLPYQKINNNDGESKFKTECREKQMNLSIRLVITVWTMKAIAGVWLHILDTVKG